MECRCLPVKEGVKIIIGEELKGEIVALFFFALKVVKLGSAIEDAKTG